MGSSQPMTVDSKNTNANPFLWSRKLLWWVTLTREAPICLDETFLELCCHLRFCVSKPVSFPLFFAGSEPMHCSDKSYLLWPFPFFPHSHLPNKSLAIIIPCSGLLYRRPKLIKGSSTTTCCMGGDRFWMYVRVGWLEVNSNLTLRKGVKVEILTGLPLEFYNTGPVSFWFSQ